jgi:hypothetical protein
MPQFSAPCQPFHNNSQRFDDRPQAVLAIEMYEESNRDYYTEKAWQRTRTSQAALAIYKAVDG